MFGILADSLRMAVFGARDHHEGHWPRNERAYRPRSALDSELHRNPFVEFPGSDRRD